MFFWEPTRCVGASNGRGERVWHKMGIVYIYMRVYLWVYEWCLWDFISLVNGVSILASWTHLKPGMACGETEIKEEMNGWDNRTCGAAMRCAREALSLVCLAARQRLMRKWMVETIEHVARPCGVLGKHDYSRVQFSLQVAERVEGPGCIQWVRSITLEICLVRIYTIRVRCMLGR